MRTLPFYPGMDVGKKTKKQQEREQRRRDKDRRRRQRQECEWKRQHLVRVERRADDIRREIEQLEAKERMRQGNLP